MTQNFRGADLQGEDFTEKNLTGADFTGADIRGVNFKGAILENAIFTKVQAGLTFNTVVGLIVIGIILTVLSAIAASIAGLVTVGMFGSYFISFKDYGIITGLILVVSFLALVIVTIQRGFLVGLVTMAIVDGTLSAIIGTIAGVLPGAGATALVIAFCLIATLTNALAIGLILTVTQAKLWIVGILEGLASLVMFMIIPLVKIIMEQLVAQHQQDKDYLVEWLTKNGVGALNISRALVAFGESPFLVIIGAFLVAVILLGLGGYVGWYSLIDEDKFAFPRSWIIKLGTIGGTSFENSDLTKADFSQALLKNTNLNINTQQITETNWAGTQGLNRASVGNNYLKSLKTRNLVVSKDGRNQDFSRLDLQVVNLIGATLTGANFTEANLNQANLTASDLSRTKLVRTRLDQTNLTEVTLTGACIEEWGLTRETTIDGIKCEYVFMRYVKPDDEDQNPVRKPDNWQENFQEGDFVDFIRPWLDTLDLFHNEGVDPRRIAIALNRLIENNPDSEIEVVAVQRKGENNDKLLIKAKTAKGVNLSQLHQEYFTDYQKLQAMSNEELLRIIAQQQSHIKRLENLVTTAFPRLQDDTPAPIVPLHLKGKWVTLKLVSGDFKTGFNFVLQIGEDGEYPTTEKFGKLPPAQEIIDTYTRWQEIYYKIVSSPRARAKVKPNNFENLQQLTIKLKEQIKQWLKYDCFGDDGDLRDQLDHRFNSSEYIRFIIQSDNIDVFRLPWHLWTFFVKYSTSEVIYGIDRNEQINIHLSPKTKIRLLSILGDSDGIDIQTDRQFLESLPDCEPVFLVNPTREKLHQCLQDEKGWDIFCFSGHSDSENGGQFYVVIKDEDGNEDLEVFTINELKQSLQLSIKNGLQMAIFNSCDGLEIARALADLNIPQIVVMREPVPDTIAQKFLTNFLTFFAKGASFHVAVRKAREILQDFETKYPQYYCASWLPVIFQNPAHIPKTWQQLHGSNQSRFIQLLAQIQQEIMVASNLEVEDRAIALEKIQILTEVEANSDHPELQKITKEAISFLRGLLVELPHQSQLFQKGNQILWEINYLLQTMIN